MKKFIFTITMLSVIVFLVFLYNYLPNQSVVSFNENNFPILVVEDNIINQDNCLIIEENNIFLSLDIVKKYINSDILFDKNENKVIFTFPNSVIRVNINSIKATINNKEIQLRTPIKKIENSIYIPMEFFDNYLKVKTNYIKESNIVNVDLLDFQTLEGMVIGNNAVIRNQPSKKASIFLKNINCSTLLKIYEEYEKWYKVKINSGVVGFIEKNNVKIMYDKYNRDISSIDTSINYNKKLSISWDYVSKKTSNARKNWDAIGLDITCPTWFSIIDKQGNILDKGSEAYVKLKKSQGYKVWGLVNNGFDPEVTSYILNNSCVRERIINDLLVLFKKYKLNGINIDFENIYLKDKDMFVQFIRELVPIFKENNIKVSVNVTPYSTSENWSMCYDRKTLGEIVDYVVLMAYDQHSKNSSIAGSVAQYSWVENGIEQILKEVSREKLILGVPFYTRLWTIENNDKAEKVSSKALSMEEAEKFIRNHNIKLIWDKQSGQHYGEYRKGNITYKIWLEDENSIRLKTSLVNKYNLVGLACWRKGFEKNEIWEILNYNI